MNRILLLFFVSIYIYSFFWTIKNKKIKLKNVFLLLLGIALFFIVMYFHPNKYSYLLFSPIILFMNGYSKTLMKFLKLILWTNFFIIFIELVLFYLIPSRDLIEWIYDSGIIFSNSDLNIVARTFSNFQVIRPRGLSSDLHVSAYLVLLLILFLKNNFLKYLLVFTLLIMNSIQTLVIFFLVFLKNNTSNKLLFIYFLIVSVIMYSYFAFDGAALTTLLGIINGLYVLENLEILDVLFGFTSLEDRVVFEIFAEEFIESGFVKLIILFGLVIFSFFLLTLFFEVTRHSSNRFVLFVNSIILFCCFAHSSIGASIWVFPTLYFLFNERYILNEN